MRPGPITAALLVAALLTGCAGGATDLLDDDTTMGTSSPADDGAMDTDAHDGMMDDGPAAETGDEAHASADVGEPADPSEATRTIEVEAFDMAFDPDRIEVAAGEVVTFVVTNTGEAVHEFVLGDAAMQEEHAHQMADDGHAHDEPNAISLAPGETKELTWRFGEAGTVEYGCHEPGHYEAGMHGEMAIS
jgi:uncharacterized cupredoxin-like copper-binding protein